MNKNPQGDPQWHLLLAQVPGCGRRTEHLLENNRDIYFLRH